MGIGVRKAIASTLVGVGLVGVTPAVAAIVAVTATIETDPVHTSGDAADDSAIWIHPTDPSLSVIIGADKSTTGGLSVYDLSGDELHHYPHGRLNNVDVRYDFPLGSSRVGLVGATNRVEKRIDFYRVNAADRSLVRAGSVPTSSAIRTPRGFALYRSPTTGTYYAFVTDSGHTDQYELDGSTGTVTGRVVRQVFISGVTEGLVADDELKRLYIAEEDEGGIWRFGAEPDAGTSGVMVVKTTGLGGPIPQDIKGIAMYYAGNGGGYLLAASQGSDSFHVLTRSDNSYLGGFEIVAGNGIDAVTGMDGIDVTNFGLGGLFPDGVFVSQDHTNDGANQNHKLVPWRSIANAFNPPLIVDNTFDPRAIGGGGEDTTPPDTRLDSYPPDPSASNAATFNFSSSEPGSTFACGLDGSPFASCTSPHSVSGLADGAHTFAVRAMDPAGNTDPTPASYSWLVDTSAPPSIIRREATAVVVNTSATNGITIGTPAGTVAGDVLVACLALNGGTVSTAPPGWVRIAAVTSVANPHIFGYYRVAGATEPNSYRFSLSSSVTNGGGIARYSGVDAAVPLDAPASVGASGTATTSASLAGVTTTTSNTMLAGCMAANSSSTSFTISSPAGMVQAWDVGGKRHELADGIQTATGPTGSRTWTFSAARTWAGWLVALRPA